MNIPKIKVIEATSNNTLTKKINKLINKGWEPNFDTFRMIPYTYSTYHGTTNECALYSIIMIRGDHSV